MLKGWTEHEVQCGGGDTCKRQVRTEQRELNERESYMLSYGEAIAGVGSRRETGIITWDEGLKTLEEKFWKGSLPRLR
jgi:hypothetical protein